MVPLFARTILLALAGLAILMPALALAQSLGSPSPLSITVTPQYPQPFSQVTLAPLSDSIDLANSTYVLSAGGKEIYRGNAKPVAITLGAAGSVVNVKATLTGGGQTVSQNLTIRAQDVTLVAEPIASAPALYLGKPLEPLDGTVRIVALANFYTAKGVAIDPSTLSYSWTVSGQQIGSASGIGKQAITVSSPLQYRAGDVSVDIQTQDGSQVGGANLTLSPQAPTLRMYKMIRSSAFVLTMRSAAPTASRARKFLCMPPRFLFLS